MALDRSNVFFGKLKEKNIAYDKLDYDLKGLAYRREFIEGLLEDNKEFLEEYFDDYFKANPKKDEALSMDNNICMKLEQIATYLLAEAEEKESSLEYRFYNDIRNFEKALRRESSLDKIVEDMSGSVGNFTEGDVIHFLVSGSSDKRLPKGMKVTDKDFNREDEVGQILREYKQYKEDLVRIKEKVGRFEYEPKGDYIPNTFKLKKMISSIDDDIYQTKYKLDRPIEFKQPISGSCVSSWDEVDFLNPIHVECFLKLTNNPLDFDSDLGMLLHYFNELFESVKTNFTDKELEVIKVLRWGVKRTDKINETLEVGFNTRQVRELYTITGQELTEIINKAVRLIMKAYESDMKNFLNKNRDKGNLFNVAKNKECIKCGERKTLSSFEKHPTSRDGYRNVCKCCR